MFVFSRGPLGCPDDVLPEHPASAEIATIAAIEGTHALRSFITTPYQGCRPPRQHECRDT
jgi:hypothetical protein